MPRTKPSTSSVIITIRLPVNVAEEIDRLLESKLTDYADRPDLLRCAIRKEVEYQRKKLNKQIIETKGEQ
jgi:metal-responsive CopG/Arc/MetJ family transcriptional regulator